MSVDYFDQNSQAYFDRSVNLDVSAQRDRFLKYLPPKAHILDAGCGSGRDAKFFKHKNYRVTAFDGSANMVALAKQHTGGMPILHKTLTEIDWQEEFAGVWAHDVLGYIRPIHDISQGFLRLGQALKPGGILYISLRWGQREIVNSDGLRSVSMDADLFRVFLNDLVWIPANVNVHEDQLTDEAHKVLVRALHPDGVQHELRLGQIDLWRSQDEAGDYWLNVILRKDIVREIPPSVEPIRVGEITKTRFDRQSTPHYGNTNPQVMDVDFWKLMIQTRQWAYWARCQFQVTGYENPIWCFDRFGMSKTKLPNGRTIYIAGEHEDAHDPDFWIYNDVIVIDENCEITIYGYPREVFPPTDFHSATLVDDFIYIIGSVGYTDTRQVGFTPVYRLHTQTFRIEEVDTSGEMPGWISRHEAVYDADTNHIIISGGQLTDAHTFITQPHTYQLDLKTLVWERV